LKKEGYTIENFCYDIKSHHLHSSAFRTETNKETHRVGDRSTYHYVEPRPMKLREPSSFCTIGTIGCIDEFVPHVLSVHRWHPSKKIYAMVDTATMNYVRECLPFLDDTLRLFPTLDRFTGKNRQIMEKEGTITEFFMLKTTAIECALKFEPDVMYLDADILVMHKMYVDPEYELGVSPHLIRKKDTDLYGCEGVCVLHKASRGL
jgi:hypothetical protein